MDITVNFISHSSSNFSYYYYQIVFSYIKFTTFYFKESLDSIQIHYYFGFGFSHEPKKNDELQYCINMHVKGGD
jgi:hypothetical protein